jgi:hypothetical protein
MFWRLAIMRHIRWLYYSYRVGQQAGLTIPPALLARTDEVTLT